MGGGRGRGGRWETEGWEGGRGRDGRQRGRKVGGGGVGGRRVGRWEGEGWEVGGRETGSRRGRGGKWEVERQEVGGGGVGREQEAVEPYLCRSVFATQLYVSDSGGERWSHVSERVVLAEL